MDRRRGGHQVPPPATEKPCLVGRACLSAFRVEPVSTNSGDLLWLHTMQHDITGGKSGAEHWASSAAFQRSPVGAGRAFQRRESCTAPAVLRRARRLRLLSSLSLKGCLSHPAFPFEGSTAAAFVNTAAPAKTAT